MSDIINLMVNFPITSAVIIMLFIANILAAYFLINTRKKRFYRRHHLRQSAYKNTNMRYHPNRRKALDNR